MKALILASAAVILSAVSAYSQAPPAPPVLIGVTPEAKAGTEQIVVTGVVVKTAAGSPVIRAGARNYEVPPTQYPLVLPYVGKQVQVVGTELRSAGMPHLLVVDHIIVSTAAGGAQGR